MAEEIAAPASENGLHEGDQYPEQSTEPLKLDENGQPYAKSN